MIFPTAYKDILAKLDAIDPESYARTRNFIDGAVTRLSVYISRGVISTNQVLNHLTDAGFELSRIEKFVQELAWRDHWQQNWLALGDIDKDILHPQEPVSHRQLPRNIAAAETGIKAIDEAIEQLYETGYMHNHIRMYVAALCCNFGQSHWLTPAKWMYYYLLDGDWASNALSWQWVAGANSNKKYIANQENINKYCHTSQRNTFLDKPYQMLSSINVPSELAEVFEPDSEPGLPKPSVLEINSAKPTYLYTHYNLDPNWGADVSANRILIFEPDVFERYPVSRKVIEFDIALSKNIPGIQTYVGSFEYLVDRYQLKEVHFKEHPFSSHFKGEEHPREWMTGVTGYHKSFFAFWKKVKKELSF